MSLPIFHRWLHEHNVRLSEGIALVQTQHTGVSVYALDAPIIHPKKLADVPKTSVLSVRTCSLRERVPWVPYGHGAVLALSLAVYLEILKGTQSKWHGYLQALPTDLVPIARLWGHPDAFANDRDAHHAAQWIEGTELQRELQDEDGLSLIEGINAFYSSNVYPLLMSVELQPTLRGFLHAYSLVCSRAFLVDAYHGLSMVPVADAFNHAHDNHVQLASDYDVCPDCGSLLECPHDRQDVTESPNDAAAPATGPVDSVDTVEMITVRSVSAGEEIFNTYGADLGNAALLARYGFSLEGGDADVVTFGWQGSSLLADDTDDSWKPTYDVLCQTLTARPLESALLYVHDDTPGRSPALCINSDGQVSAGLFAYAAHVALSNYCRPNLHGTPASDQTPAKATLMSAVLDALSSAEAQQDRDMDADDHYHDPNVRQILSHIASTLCGICESRIAQMGMETYRGASMEVLGELLDELPPSSVKTRLALGYLIGERAILETCAAQWEDLHHHMSELAVA